MHQDWVMTTATVKFFNVQKGLGFISPEDGGQDVFVQVTAVEQAGMTRFTEGRRVSFAIQPDKRGTKAVKLKPA